MAKIIGIGNALVDVLLYIDDEKLLSELHLPKGGMTLIGADDLERLRRLMEGSERQCATGGSASNTIHALAALGNATGFVGCVGQDEMGEFYSREMQARGTEAVLRQTDGLHTGIATTFITPDGERTFATYLGAAALVEAAELKRLIDNSPEAEVLHVEGYLVQDHDLIVEILRTARAAGLAVSFDLASWNIVEADHDFIAALVRDYVDIVFANEEEAAAFSLQRDPEEALRQLAAVAGTAVVKVGARGALAMCGAEHAAVPGLQRKVVDTTAAGDFFAAGFLHGRVNGAPLERCLDYGNRLAGEVIQVYGTEVTAERLRHAIAI